SGGADRTAARIMATALISSLREKQRRADVGYERVGGSPGLLEVRPPGILARFLHRRQREHFLRRADRSLPVARAPRELTEGQVRRLRKGPDRRRPLEGLPCKIEVSERFFFGAQEQPREVLHQRRGRVASTSPESFSRFEMPAGQAHGPAEAQAGFEKRT